MSDILPCSPLMCVAVAAILPPGHQALLRSASTTGVAAYNEVVEQSSTNMYVETDDSILADGKDRVPCTLPLPADVGTLVVYTNESSAVTGGVAVGPITRMRYEGGPQVVELGGVRSRRNSPELDPCLIEIVTFSGFKNIVVFGNFFLFGFTSLKSVDLSPFINASGVGNGFMTRCTTLTSIDLAPLSNVTTVGNHFMWNCSALTAIDLKPLRDITSMGDSFMLGCSSLTAIDVGPLSKLTHIPSEFIGDCTSLTSINLTPLSHVTEVGNEFLGGCASLTAINLLPFSKVTAIGNRFLAGCSSLKDVDVTPLSGVVTVGYGFMDGASICTPTAMDVFGPEMSRVIEKHYGGPIVA